MKAQTLKETTTHELKENMELINIPKLNSEYDDGTVNGTKFFQVRIKTPITKGDSGWGSSGLYSLEVDGCLFYDTTHSSWWDSSFEYRRPIEINVTENISDYQLLLNVTYDSDMQNDFADIRFTDENENELSYWIESKSDGNYANVWIKATLNTTNESKYMYYSNTTTVTTQSNRSNIFDKLF